MTLISNFNLQWFVVMVPNGNDASMATKLHQQYANKEKHKCYRNVNQINKMKNKKLKLKKKKWIKC